MPVSRYCSNCGPQAEADAVYCSECGNDLTYPRISTPHIRPAGEVICSRCGASNPSESDYCDNCGSIIKAANSGHNELQVQTTNKKPLGVWWLLIFVPVVGCAIALTILRKQVRNLASLTITLIIFANIVSNLR